eukprot:4194505-Pyramimonas_sp.AAC.1
MALRGGMGASDSLYPLSFGRPRRRVLAEESHLRYERPLAGRQPPERVPGRAPGCLRGALATPRGHFRFHCVLLGLLHRSSWGQRQEDGHNLSDCEVLGSSLVFGG